MKLLFSIVFCLISFLCFSQSQQKLNEDALKEYKKAENEINSVYKKILKEYSADSEFIKKLRVAQRLWIQFRDADIEARYPDGGSNYGSVAPMCIYFYKTELTNKRIEALKLWLTGITEGDVCSGTVKIKE